MDVVDVDATAELVTTVELIQIGEVGILIKDAMVEKVVGTAT